VLDETLSEIGIQDGLRVAQQDKIDHRQRGHQFRAGTLRKQRLRGIRYFHHQQLARIAGCFKPTHVFGEKRVEVTGYL
jgi:hypothetical protein